MAKILGQIGSSNRSRETSKEAIKIVLTRKDYGLEVHNNCKGLDKKVEYTLKVK